MMAVVITYFPTSGNNQDSILGKKNTISNADLQGRLLD